MKVNSKIGVSPFKPSPTKQLNRNQNEEQINALSEKLHVSLGKKVSLRIIAEFLQWIDVHGTNGVQFKTRFSRPESIPFQEWSKGITDIWTCLREKDISGTVTLDVINQTFNDRDIDLEEGCKFDLINQDRQLLYTPPRQSINGPGEYSDDGDGVREPLITNSSSSSRGCSTRTVVLASVCSALFAAAITVGALYETGHLK
ncbi:MAG: hypothetical protein ACON35_04815 [Candidatus Marinamargulisbacteria bacterium]